MTFDDDGAFLVLGTKAGSLYALNVEEGKTDESEYDLVFSVQKFSVSQAGITSMTFVPETSTQNSALLVNSMENSVAILLRYVVESTFHTLFYH